MHKMDNHDHTNSERVKRRDTHGVRVRAVSRFVSPTPFDVTMSIIFLMMAMVGGSGYLLGAVVGAALITLLKNWIQDVLPIIAPSTSGQLEIVVFSALFIVFLQRARDGIVPYLAQWLPEAMRRRPSVRSRP